MFIYQRLIAGWLYAAVLLLMMSSQAWATPSVLYRVDDLGGGLFQYNLLLDNQGGSEPLSGLNILNGNSLFGLDGSSVVGVPADWSFFAPFPPFVDDLDFFSLNAAADIPIDGELGGFFFQSTLDPVVVKSSGFAVEGIGAISASQIALDNARFVPEPPTLLLLSIGLAGLVGSYGKKEISKKKQEHGGQRGRLG